jgi:hypothetical protein
MKMIIYIALFINFLASLFFLWYTQFDRILIDIFNNPVVPYPLALWGVFSIIALYHICKIFLSLIRDEKQYQFNVFIEYMVVFAVTSALFNFLFDVGNYGDPEYSALSNISHTVGEYMSFILDMRSKVDVVKTIFLYANFVVLLPYYFYRKELN